MRQKQAVPVLHACEDVVQACGEGSMQAASHAWHACADAAVLLPAATARYG